MNRLNLILTCLLGIFVLPCQARDATAHYIANAGVMIVRGDTKILFDPLFTNSYGDYTLPPREMRDAIVAGKPPYDGIDAVFISHYHGDHFSPAEMIDLLTAQPSLRLYAPNRQQIDHFCG